MPRSAGTMTLVAGNPVVSGTVISSAVQNNTMNDIANEITNSIPRDGSAPPTANLPLGNFKITGIGAATLTTDAPQYQQIQSGASLYLTAVAGTNTITGTLASPTLAAYAAGNTFRFTAAGTNTGATTVNINALGAKTIQKDGSALIAGDITTGRTYELIYDGTNFQLLSGTGISSGSIQNQTYTTFTTGGTSTAYTLTPTPALSALATGQRFNVTFNATAGATPTLAISGLAAKSLKYYDSTGTKQAITSSIVVANLNSDVIYDGTDYVVLNPIISTTSTVTLLPAVRQTILNGTVDTNGLPSFGGATGSTTVTTSTTLTATAANGTANRTGSIVNPSWTGLSTNGTMSLYLDIDSLGVCTPGSTTLPPTYRFGGADVVTSGQFTFNTQEMVGKVGNGATAAQTYRVFVGQVTVAAGVVSAITWYALMGRYRAPLGSAFPAGATRLSLNHNIGIPGLEAKHIMECITIDSGYAVGDEVEFNCFYGGTDTILGVASVDTLTTGIVTSSSTVGLRIKTTANANTITLARWNYRPLVKRSW